MMIDSRITCIHPNERIRQIFLDFAAADAPYMFSIDGWNETYRSLCSRDLRYELPADFEPENSYGCSEFNGMPVYTMGNQDTYDRILLYLHGGGYVYTIGEDHLIFIRRLSRVLNMKIVVPLYPVAPESTFEDAYDLLNGLYRNLLKEGKPVVVMGESAGGGLALGLVEQFRDTGMPLPSGMVLLSPWVDITMSNEEISGYETVDMMLRSYGLIQCGKMWAGNTDPRDFRLSPIYGSMSGLPPALIYVGNHEIFYPDNYRLFEKLKERNILVHLIVGEGLGHTYPRYVPEDNPQYREILQPLIDFASRI